MKPILIRKRNQNEKEETALICTAACFMWNFSVKEQSYHRWQKVSASVDEHGYISKPQSENPCSCSCNLWAEALNRPILQISGRLNETESSIAKYSSPVRVRSDYMCYSSCSFPCVSVNVDSFTSLNTSNAISRSQAQREKECVCERESEGLTASLRQEWVQKSLTKKLKRDENRNRADLAQ
jgi:hypothetical protein